MPVKFLYVWLLLPAVALAVHYGPGQKWLERDDAAALVRAANHHSDQADWEQAAATYAAALLQLPEEAIADRQSLQVSLGRALVKGGSIIEGQELLEKTLSELSTSGEESTALAQAARYELATSSYDAAWIMRLEGATTDEWLPEAEIARQNFRLLAESASSDEASTYERSLEATIRLEQMDLSELLAKPLPKNCPNCKGGLCQRKRKQTASRCQSEGKKQGKGEEKKDARQEIKKTNSAGLYSGGNDGS
ncbi:hypothetical protein NA78x_005172 [Anatilimnocola sp. NA78]|uniref:hypothetical protein n=1 Tax=Anatilimnocola sp. NA78 TaxID=3415683 RepID=UPI003CE49045